METVLLAMSGGVDSSVAALLLLQQGYKLHGITMDVLRTDASRIAADRAAALASQLGFPHTTVDLKDEFDRLVVDDFVSAYEAAVTPNPCVTCNREMKFGLLNDIRREMGLDLLATGHYARVSFENGRYCLKKALDIKKDQAYFLNRLTQEQLSTVLFPLGELAKEDIRRIAAEHSFESSHQKDSQDICFIENGDYAAFIENYTGKKYPEGDFVSPEGKILGRHKGLIHYTLGQRRGLGVSSDARLFVNKIDPVLNTVTLCHEDDPSSILFSDYLEADCVNWVSRGFTPLDSLRCLVRFRSAQKEQEAYLTCSAPDRIAVSFDTPQRAITPGQSLVAYDDDGRVICGGRISLVRHKA